MRGRLWCRALPFHTRVSHNLSNACVSDREPIGRSAGDTKRAVQTESDSIRNIREKTTCERHFG